MERFVLISEDDIENIRAGRKVVCWINGSTYHLMLDSHFEKQHTTQKEENHDQNDVTK